MYLSRLCFWGVFFGCCGGCCCCENHMHAVSTNSKFPCKWMDFVGYWFMVSWFSVFLLFSCYCFCFLLFIFFFFSLCNWDFFPLWHTMLMESIVCFVMFSSCWACWNLCGQFCVPLSLTMRKHDKQYHNLVQPECVAALCISMHEVDWKLHRIRQQVVNTDRIDCWEQRSVTEFCLYCEVYTWSRVNLMTGVVHCFILCNQCRQCKLCWYVNRELLAVSWDIQSEWVGKAGECCLHMLWNLLLFVSCCKRYGECMQFWNDIK